MSVLNINQFYSKEKVRTNKDYELTPQSEWVYGEKEMILFARRYLAYWKEANGVTSKNRKALHKHIVSGSALADAYHGGWRRSKKYAKETNFHGLNRKEIKKYFDKWYEEHYR